MAKDPWNLLNATPQALRSWAAADDTRADGWPADQVNEVVAYLQAMRVLYVAKLTGEPTAEGENAALQVEVIIKRRTGGVYLLPSYFEEDGKAIVCLLKRSSHEGGRLWNWMERSLMALLRDLENPKLYQCQRCGRIGDYTSQRVRQFCSDRCRIASDRAKKKEVEAQTTEPAVGAAGSVTTDKRPRARSRANGN